MTDAAPPRRPERRLGLIEAIGHPAVRAVHRRLGREMAEGLAAAPVARQTGRVAQCPLTESYSGL